MIKAVRFIKENRAVKCYRVTISSFGRQVPVEWRRQAMRKGRRLVIDVPVKSVCRFASANW